MKRTIMALLLISFGPVKIRTACQTTIKYVDCDDQAVAGATIQVRRCSDKKPFSATTNSSGEAVFPLCKDSICSPTVISTELPTKKKPSFSCTGNYCIFKRCLK